MHGEKFVQAKESIHLDRFKRPKFGEGSGEQYFLREMIKCNLGSREKFILTIAFHIS